MEFSSVLAQVEIKDVPSIVQGLIYTALMVGFGFLLKRSIDKLDASIERLDTAIENIIEKLGRHDERLKNLEKTRRR